MNKFRKMYEKKRGTTIFGAIAAVATIITSTITLKNYYKKKKR